MVFIFGIPKKWLELMGILVLVGWRFESFSQRVTFTFCPRPGTVCLITQHRSIKTEITGREPVIEDELHTSEFHVEQNEGFYFITDQGKESSWTVNGKEHTNPMASVLEAVVTTNVISSSGELIRVLGDERFLPEAKTKFPTNMYPMLETALSKETMDGIARSQWMETAGVFAGRTVAQGDVWKDQISSADSNLHIQYQFPSIVTARSNAIVTILEFGCTDSKLLNRYRLENARSLDSPEVNDFLDWIAINLPGEKDCTKPVIDAKTLNTIAEEEINQTVIAVPEGIRIRIEKIKREYSYMEASSKLEPHKQNKK